LARKFFPDEDPLGKSIIMEPPKEFLPKQSPEPPDAPRRTIVGVVTDIKNAGLDQPAQPEVYAPLTQCEFEGWSNTVSFAVKTDGDPLRMAPAIRTIVADLDPTLPVANVSSMDQLVGNSLSNARFSLILLTFFAASALLLTALGIYGVIADSIRQRTREIGVRVALGARPSEIFRLVVGGGMKLAALGLAIGLALSFVLTQALTSLLYGVKPSDPATYLFVTVILAGVSLLACYLPARRSTRVDPMVALRYE
jgi:putative ABC transport system permease protein